MMNTNKATIPYSDKQQTTRGGDRDALGSTQQVGTDQERQDNAGLCTKDPFEEKLFKMLAAYGMGHLKQSLNDGDTVKENGERSPHTDKKLAQLLNEMSENAQSHSGKDLIRGFCSDPTDPKQAEPGALNVSAVDPPSNSTKVSPKWNAATSSKLNASRQRGRRNRSSAQTFRRPQLTSNYPFVDEEKSVMDDIMCYPESMQQNAGKKPAQAQESPPSKEEQAAKETKKNDDIPLKKRYRVHRRPRQWNILRRAISGESPPSVQDVHKINHKHKNTLAEEDHISYYSDSEVDAVYPKWWPSESENNPAENNLKAKEENDVPKHDYPLDETESEEEVWHEQEGQDDLNQEVADVAKQKEDVLENSGNSPKKGRESKRTAKVKDLKERKKAASKNKARQDGTLDRIERRKQQEREAADNFRKTLKHSAAARERFLGIPRSKQQGNQSARTFVSTSGRSSEETSVNSEAQSRRRVPSYLRGVQSRIRDRVKSDRERYHNNLRNENHGSYYSPRKGKIDVGSGGAAVSNDSRTPKWQTEDQVTSQPAYSTRDQELLAQATEQYQKDVERLKHDDEHVRAKPGSIAWTIPLNEKDDTDMTTAHIPTPPAQVARDLRKRKETQSKSNAIAQDSARTFKEGCCSRVSTDEFNDVSAAPQGGDISLKGATGGGGQPSEERIVHEAEDILDTLGIRSEPQGSAEAVQAESAAYKASKARASSVDPYLLQRQSRRPPSDYSLHIEKPMQWSNDNRSAADYMRYVYGGEYVSKADQRLQTDSIADRYNAYSSPLQIARTFLNGPVMAALSNKENSLFR